MANDAAHRYPASYVAFMRECKMAFLELGEAVERGDVAAGNSCTVQVTVPANVIDQIRFEQLAAMAEVGEVDDG